MGSGVCRGTGIFSKVCLAIAAAISCDFACGADELRNAHVTEVVQDVKLLPNQAAARPALINDEVKQGTGIRTGADSRSELTFNDLTITRLGANTVFSFNRETRELKLSSGAALLQIPPAAPELKVSNQLVSAAISGGTAIFDAATGKFMVLEGEGRMWPNGHPEQILKVHAGNLVWLTANGHVSMPKTFDVKLIMKTSRLITGFGRLANLDLIMKVIEEQQAIIGPTPPMPLFQDIISQKIAASTLPQVAPDPPPPPPPAEFGSPQTITSPAPYGIDSTAVISTDPTITKDGVTDFGTIYRNQTQDGPIGAWAFGSTSAFDITIGFGSNADTSFQNIAVFKFQSLELNGVPTINTDGGATRLGLIAVDGITSAGAGGTFTFSGLNFVFLATENGGINLGSQITFQGLNRLLFYARGTNGNMTLSSQFNDISTLDLNAEGAIEVNGESTFINAPTLTLQAGRTLTWAGSMFLTVANADSNASIHVSAGDDIIIRGGVGIVRSSGGTDNAMNVSFSAGTDLLVEGPMGINLAPTLIHTGGNISISAGNNIAVAGPMTLNTDVVSDLFSGGNITVSSANGNLTAQTIQAGIKVDPGVLVTSGANLSLNALGDIRTTSESTANGILLGVNTGNGGRIGNSTAVSVIAGGNITTAGALALSVDNSNGGTIGSNAAISLTAANVTADNFSEVINNPNGGMIRGDASIVLNLSGDLTATGNGEMDFRILNYAGVAGGNINGSAAVTITAANITAQSLVADMDGEGGLIGNNATIAFNISGSVKVATNLNVHIEQGEPAVGMASTGAAPDAITFNGGTYQVGNSFAVFVDSRDGTITMNNVNMHADIVKVGAFGSDGVLKIGGGSINANTLLKLYAPGSNGVIDFVANVTLNSQGAAAVISANTVTIENNVVVTITGAGGTALVYTNHPNYSGFGGNGTTSGTFAGKGAITAPFASAPPLEAASSNTSAALTTSSISTRVDGSGTRPLKHRGTRVTAPRQSVGNPVGRPRSVPRIALRMSDSTALLDVIDDTASKDFSLAKHARSKFSQAPRDPNSSSHHRTRPDDSRRTLSASRDRTPSAGARLPKP